MKAKFFSVIYPGKGYRLVNIGEALCKGDEVSIGITGVINEVTRKWEKIGDHMVGETINESGKGNEMVIRPYGYYRRKI